MKLILVCTRGEWESCVYDESEQIIAEYCQDAQDVFLSCQGNLIFRMVFNSISAVV